ncbi:hypothetical protein [Halarcobacter anaerophilus]|uniref:hypothetical protein n=1 Tax=Halarcobacter anaerophilus TaxID=877500 RepID=UPI000696AA63|nr:hypothetical protein [Halarcobacter anaerophilus]
MARGICDFVIFSSFYCISTTSFTLPNKKILSKQIEHEDNAQYSRFEGKKNTKRSMILIGVALCLIAIPIASIQTHLIGILDSLALKQQWL